MTVKDVLERMCDMVLHPRAKGDAESANRDLKAKVEAMIKGNAVGISYVVSDYRTTLYQ